MDRIIRKIYRGLMIVAFILVILIPFFDRLQVVNTREQKEARKLTNLQYEVAENPDAPCRTTEIYRITLSDISDEGEMAAFYSKHQNVRVYVGDELVYEMVYDSKNILTKDTGDQWNYIPVSKMDTGKELRIELDPLFSSVKEESVEVYIGSGSLIFMEVLKDNLVLSFLGIMALLIGIIFILYAIYLKTQKKLSHNIMNLGSFSFWIGIWKLADLQVTAMLIPYSLVLSYIPFIALLFVVVSFILYLKDMFTEKNHFLWYVPIFSSLAVVLITLLFQIFGISEMRQMLIFNHIVMGMTIVVSYVMLGLEIHRHGMNRQIGLIMICMMLCLIGTAIDLVFYYFQFDSGKTQMGMLGFLALIIGFGWYSIRETKRLILNGYRADALEKIAYLDPMTGLFNRSAYEKKLNSDDFHPEKKAVFVFDLNDLKMHNDVYGHETGDEYIKNGASFIYDVFSEKGECFRIGGDEFCVIAEDLSAEECEDLCQKLRNCLSEYNKGKSKKDKVHIACGYERFDEAEDWGIDGTIRRADKRMYEDKMKQKMK